MTLNHCFKVRHLILVGALITGLGLVTHASAQQQSFFVDLNTKTVTPLGMLGNWWSSPYSTNDAGQVVGDSLSERGARAFITGPDGVGMRDLGTLGGGESWAFGINDAGQVVGWSSTAGGPLHAFITGPDGVGMRDLGTLGGSESTAYGINDFGQVVGESNTSQGGPHAFITGADGMGMRDLGTLGGSTSRAWAINEVGQVVGRSGGHAFITGPDGEGMMDLNSLVDLPVTEILTEAIDINNNGQIIAIVPEPETYALMLAGLGLIGFMARRKRLEVRI